MKRIFLKGLMAVLPVGITIALLIWIVGALERAFGAIVKWIPAVAAHYHWGMGITFGLVVTFGIGLLLQFWLLERLWGWIKGLLAQIPLVKTLFSAVTDLMGFFSTKGGSGASQVVMVELVPGTRAIGLITRSDFGDLPAGVGGTGMVAVYLPMSYAIGGYTVILPADRVTPVAMTVEAAMRFAVTAGMTAREEKD